MAEQTRTIGISAIRTALEWYHNSKGMPSPASMRAAMILRNALDSDEHYTELQSQVKDLTERIAELERSRAVYGPITMPQNPQPISLELDVVLRGAAASGES